MKTSHSALIALTLSFAGLAFAGEAEREYYAENTEPAVKKATATLKKSCGCDVKFDIQMETFETRNHLLMINMLASEISEKAPGYWSDAPSNAAICKLKTVNLSRTKESALNFSNGKIVWTTNGNSYFGWDTMVEKLDK